ncbi:right-handed parallel beta-helix repeat-containing protein [Oleiharenicola lentus]|uniref:right-handed parallel beta-helix repeat-containing protein n=1 Tax=Oleiharenicola lentus TaxID=2508720 RepID=UPI003F66DDDD
MPIDPFGRPTLGTVIDPAAQTPFEAVMLNHVLVFDGERYFSRIAVLGSSSYLAEASRDSRWWKRPDGVVQEIPIRKPTPQLGKNRSFVAEHLPDGTWQVSRPGHLAAYLYRDGIWFGAIIGTQIFHIERTTEQHSIFLIKDGERSLVAAFAFNERGQLLLISLLCIVSGQGSTILPEISAALPDFGAAGASEKWQLDGLPVLLVSSGAGDMRSSLQHAIDKLSELSPSPNGLRGVLQLQSGRYEVGDPLRISASGIIIRGATDPNARTVLVSTSTNGEALVVVAPTDFQTKKKDDPIASLSQTKPKKLSISSSQAAGARRVDVAEQHDFKVGDEVLIWHPGTSAWLAQVRNGETNGVHSWRPGWVDIPYYRIITSTSGSWLEFDAPLYEDFDQAVSGATIEKATSPVLRKFLLEDLNIVVRDSGGNNDRRTRTGIRLSAVADSEVRNVVVQGYSTSGFELGRHCRRITIDKCTAAAPFCEDEETGRGYGFRLKGAELVLFRGCKTTGARYGFVMGGCWDSGVAIVDCQSSDNRIGGFVSVGPWAHAILLDNFRVDGSSIETALDLGNRHDDEEGRGWTCVRSVAWNCELASGGIRVQRPPLGQNFAIGCTGEIVEGSRIAPKGEIVSAGTQVTPRSLYE